MPVFHHSEPKNVVNRSNGSNSPTINDAENGQATYHPQYPTSDAGGYKGSGGAVSRFITPGGNPIDNSQPAFPIYHRRFGNPAPLGLLAFAATTFILSMYNVGTRNVTAPNVVVGMALGYGGLVQLIAGIEEWACGNSFGATAFASYGGFWLSYASLFLPIFGIQTAYENNAAEFASAVGIYLAAWAIVTMIFFLATLKSSVALSSLFFFLTVTFWLLCAGELATNKYCTKAGGAFGILTAGIAAYTALAGLLTKDTSHFKIPVGNLSRGQD